MLVLLDKWESAEKRLMILRELIVDGSRVSEICERHAISRMTFYRWLKAYQEAGFEDLTKKSTRPRQVYSTPREIEAIIQELYTRMGMGCKNISQTVKPLYIISHVGVLRVLKRLGYVPSREKRRWKSFRYVASGSSGSSQHPDWGDRRGRADHIVARRTEPSFHPATVSRGMVARLRL